MTVRIGLVSDTHMPMRLRELPAPLFTALRGVDLLLHAGDVGKLSTLDELSELAPVVAVHGNDDSEEARQFLPYKTVVPCAGERIFLWHSHYEDRQEEFASREGDEIVPKLHRISREAAAAGARIAVFGHWHIPLVHEVDGVTIVNPGAVASGNAISRQLVQTVALLEMAGDGALSVQHVDLAHPHAAYDPAISLRRGLQVRACPLLRQHPIAGVAGPACRRCSVASATRTKPCCIRFCCGWRTAAGLESSTSSTVRCCALNSPRNPLCPRNRKNDISRY